jgi:mono/diheme cytochrome c family protein
LVLRTIADVALQKSGSTDPNVNRNQSKDGPMKKVLQWVGLTLVVSACSNGGVEEGVAATAQQELNVAKVSNLTKEQGGLSAESDEGARQTDTLNYYNTFAPPATLAGFIATYGFTAPGADVAEATYYNRGGLGIGREMHCVDTYTANGTIACYVRNFAAGDDGSEFTFGLSADTAFTNANSGNAFATVAMVFRNPTFAPVAAADRVRFVVYNGAGSAVLYAAALDRVGIVYANAFNNGTSLTELGTPGVNFNNHIPSNCASCHGGIYNSSNKSISGSLFLPFDLDQFEYENVPGKRRADQEPAFKRLNQMVRKMALRSGFDLGNSIVKQLDGWYNNDLTNSNVASRPETFSNNFNSAFIPAGWNANTATRTAYTSVVRPACRNCHVANRILQLHFDDEASFAGLIPLIATDVRDFIMPHSLQSVRTFWQSPQPTALEKYFIAAGYSAEATIVHNAGPADVATLDPHLVSSLQLGR